jgi:DNA repair protein RecN (Recombination protein N)
VEFLIATNPGAPFAPLGKIASGGELSRFILALKVALAEQGGAARSSSTRSTAASAGRWPAQSANGWRGSRRGGAIAGGHPQPRRSPRAGRQHYLIAKASSDGTVTAPA